MVLTKKAYLSTQPFSSSLFSFSVLVGERGQFLLPSLSLSAICYPDPAFTLLPPVSLGPFAFLISFLQLLPKYPTKVVSKALEMTKIACMASTITMY